MGVGGAGDERRSLSGMTPAERQAFMGIIRVLPNGQTMGYGRQYDNVDYTDDDLPDFIAWYNDQGWDNGERPLRAEGRLSEGSHAIVPGRGRSDDGATAERRPAPNTRVRRRR